MAKKVKQDSPTVAKVKAFFSEIEQVWAGMPKYVHVFVYSFVTATLSAWLNGSIDWKVVISAVAINIGIYEVPRKVNQGVKKL